MVLLIADGIEADDITNCCEVAFETTQTVSYRDMFTFLFDVKNTHVLLKHTSTDVPENVWDVLRYRGAILIRTPTCTLYELTSEEGKYLKLMKRALKNGCVKSDRTHVGTKSLFGESLRFSLRDNRLPLITTKRVFFRGVLEELLWFIRGSTDSCVLAEKNVHIWDANGTKEQLSALGLGDREVGDLGPVYGFQWRHWGAEYVDKYTPVTDGVDQLKRVIEQLVTDPDSRRHIVSAWNVQDLDKMALPPCHMFFQFYVREGKYLSCQMYQRSADMFLGVPFNIASYALLTHIVAKITNLIPEELIMVFGDTHVYSNHTAAVLEQCARIPNSFPTVYIDEVTSIDDIDTAHIHLKDYDHQSSIKAPMAV